MPVQGVPALKGGRSLRGPLTLVILVSELHTDLDQLKDEASPYIMLVALLEPSLPIPIFFIFF